MALPELFRRMRRISIAHLEGVPPADDREIVDHREGRADLYIQSIRAQVMKPGTLTFGRHAPDGGMVECRAVHAGS